MARTGRPKIEINWNEVEGMAKVHATLEDIASHIGVHKDTLLKRCKREFKMTFSEYLEQKRAYVRNNLRRKQIETAMSGNVTMQIWLGKQMLGQTEKVEQTNRNTHEVINLQEIFNDPEAAKAVEKVADAITASNQE